MDAAHWERMQGLFHEALAQPETQRSEFLEAACGDDRRLLEDLLALLRADSSGNELLEGNLAEVAHAVLGEPSAYGRIGRYRVLKTLGEGGMGVVYLAEREDLEQRVAVKVLRDALLSPARRERFAREERVLAQLNHPSIATLYDADTLADGTPFFVMEYVEGVPLTSYCDARECSLRERLRLFRSVCEAVQYAHGQAVVHRDLKPSNILVRPDGQVKLLDFGIAKQIEVLDAPAAETQTGFRLMTPAYAAPEQLRGAPLGVYTDVYALGVILYELLTGVPPFAPAGRSPGELEVLILTEEVERPSARVRRSGEDRPAGRIGSSRRAWRDLDVLCLTAMHKDVSRRYATVEALMRDLDHFLQERPLEARPDTLSYRTGKFLRRNRRTVATAGLVSLGAVGLSGYYAVRLAEARDSAVAEAEKAKEISEYLIGLFEAGDPFGTGAEELDVPTLLRRGVEGAEELASRPVVHAQMLDVLGRVYTQLSQYDAAGPLLTRALTIRREGDNPLDLAETLVHVGRLRALTGANDSAAVALREALAIRERELSADHPAVAVILNDLGDLATTTGDYQNAEALYRRALRIQRGTDAEPPEEIAHTLNNLAVNFFNQADPAAAEPYYREALAVYREAHGPGHPNVAMGLANLGMVLEARGEYSAAEAMMSEAVAIRRSTLGNEHYLTAFGLVQLGSLMRKTNEYDRAEAYLREAIAINDRLLGSRHLQSAVARLTLAWTLREQGEHAAAEPLLREAADAFRETAGDRHYYTGSTLSNLAETLHLQGKGGEEAERLFRQGLAIQRAVLPPGHASLAVNEGAFGAMLAAHSRFAEAEPLLLSSHGALAAAGHAGAGKAAQRLVDLYLAWGKPGQAQLYQLAASPAAEPVANR